MMIRAACLLLVLWSALAHGGSLGAPFSFESTAVLPKGIRNVSFQGFTTEAFNKYNTDGNHESISSALNKRVTWQDIVGGQESTQQGQSLQALLLDLGKDLNEVVGQTTGVVNVRATVTAPAIAYGLTEKWTIALAVPIVYSSTNIDTGFLAEQVLENFVGNELVAQGLALQAERAAAKFVDLVNQKAISNGYEPMVGESNTRIGDVKIVNKYQIFKAPTLAVAVKQDVSLPTGTQANPHKVVDVGSGDAQWDLGFGAVVDFTPIPSVTITSHVSYTAQLADYVTRHLPKSIDDSMSPDVDNNIYRDLGDIFALGASARYTLWEIWSLSTGYLFQAKGADVFLGSQFEAFRYEVMEFDTHQRMHSLQLGLDFSTIPLFQAKKFMVPLQAGLAYTRVMAGENVGADSILGFKLAVFF